MTGEVFGRPAEGYPPACPYCLRGATLRGDHIECQEHGRWTLDGGFYVEPSHPRSCRCDACWSDARDGFGPG